MKKVLCAVLCLALLLGLCPTALAAGSDDFDIQNGVLVEYTGPAGKVTIPAGVTEIGPKAFRSISCWSITSLTIPEGCVKIGEEAFYSLGDMTFSVTVTLPSTLREIGNRAFAASHITRINLPDGLETIGREAFRETLLESVTLPASLSSVGTDAFRSCDSLTQVSWPGHTLTQAEVEKYFFGTPFYYGGGGITEPDPGTNTGSGDNTAADASYFTIENGVLIHCSAYSATSITVPEGVTRIGENPFSSCIQMREVILPSTLRTIGARAFDGTALRRIDIPDGVTSIESFAFSRCRYLTQVSMPAGLTRLEEHAFQDCVSLTQIQLPAGLQSIGEYAFSGCRQLKNVNLPASLTQIGDNAFQGTALSGAVNLPSGLKTLGDWAFSNTSITSITLPEGMDSIGASFVNNCGSLTSITFPKTGKAVEGMKDLPPSAFYSTYTGSSVSLKEMNNIPSAPYAQRVAAMRAVIDGLGTPQSYLRTQSAAITAKAREITAGISGDYEKARAIYEWVVKNIKYDTEYYNGRKSTTNTYADDVLANRLAVCGGISNLTMALLQAVDIPAIYIHGWAGGSEWSSGAHAWNAAYVDGRWILLDATWGNSGGFSILGTLLIDWAVDRYFDCSVFFLASDHSAGKSDTNPSQEAPEPDGEDPAPTPAPTQPQTPTFADVPAGAYYANAVSWAVSNNITNGTSTAANTFSPDKTCTQLEILTFLYRAARGEGAASGEDMAKAAVWAKEKGIIDDTFDGGTPCTRATAMRYIWQALGSHIAVGVGFTDVPTGTDYYAAVVWGVANGVTNGYGDTFRPDQTCTRGQIATFLHRAYVPSARLAV